MYLYLWQRTKYVGAVFSWKKFIRFRIEERLFVYNMKNKINSIFYLYKEQIFETNNNSFRIIWYMIDFWITYKLMKIDEMMILLLKIILRKYFKQNSINELLN